MLSQPELLWTNKLDGTISMGTPDYVPPGVPTTPHYFRSDWSGSDRLGNGKTQLQTALGGNVSWQNYYSIVTPDDVGAPPTLADLPAVFTFALAANDLPGGTGNKIVMTQKKRSSTKWGTDFRPQAGCFVTLTQTNQVYDLYVRKIFKVPSNMVNILSGADPSTGWCELDAIKASNDFGPTVDLRYSIQIQKRPGESGLRFMAEIDRGTGATPLTGYPLRSAEGSCVPGSTYLGPVNAI